MNIAMEQTEEFVDGQLKAKYGDCFIRGNNGELLLCASPIIFLLVVEGDVSCFSFHTVLYISTQKRT
jgi:hypothetical protein